MPLPTSPSTTAASQHENTRTAYFRQEIPGGASLTVPPERPIETHPRCLETCPYEQYPEGGVVARYIICPGGTRVPTRVSPQQPNLVPVPRYPKVCIIYTSTKSALSVATYFIHSKNIFPSAQARFSKFC